MINKPSENQITIWEDPKVWLQSMYGRIRYKGWCLKEIHRLRKAGIEVYLATNTNGFQNKWVCVMRRNPEEILS